MGDEVYIRHLTKTTLQYYSVGLELRRINETKRAVRKLLATSCAGGRHNMPRPLQVDL